MTLEERFFAAVADEMANRGWIASERRPTIITPVAGRYWRTLRDDQTSSNEFVSTAQFTCEQVGDARSKGRARHDDLTMHVEVDIGITCPSVERLLASLDAQHRNVAVEVDLGTLVAPSRDVSIDVEAKDMISPDLIGLMTLIDKHAEMFAAERASLRAFVATFQSDPTFDEFQAEFVPAMFGAFGCASQARAALDQYEALASSREFRVFAQRLRGFLDSGDAVHQYVIDDDDLPASRDATWGRRVAMARKLNRARRDAMRAVREAGRTSTRDERRAMLQTELSRRNAIASSVWIEARLDVIGESDQHSDRGTARRALTKIVRDTVRNLRQGVSEDAAWIEPPDRACYKIEGVGLSWLDIELSADAESWLDRVYRGASRKFGDAVMLKVWLDWCAPSSGDRPQLAAAIGSKRVGLLHQSDARVVSEAMAMAGEREELPWAQGRLTRRESAPRYVLEIRAGCEGV